MTTTLKNQNRSLADADHHSGEGSDPVGPNVDAKTEAAAPTAPSTKPPSKQQQLAALVVRDEGATLARVTSSPTFALKMAESWKTSAPSLRWQCQRIRIR